MIKLGARICVTPSAGYCYASRWRKFTDFISESLTHLFKRFIQEGNKWLNKIESLNHSTDSFKNTESFINKTPLLYVSA